MILDKVVKAKTKSGYKVVAVIKGKKGYYSPATGIKYPVSNKRKVSPCVKQHKLAMIYRSDLLSKSNKAFCKEMTGRTGILLNLKDARSIKETINLYRLAKGVTIKIVKATLSDEILQGNFFMIYHSLEVYAGKRIIFSKEVE